RHRIPVDMPKKARIIGGPDIFRHMEAGARDIPSVPEVPVGVVFISFLIVFWIISRQLRYTG
ncbi:MAG TPA: hypothetical protein VGR57_06665, partial [Ktedonobacterales bacterium]|nr:hypothetical protein [Ktedonobacterales bacterium]